MPNDRHRCETCGVTHRHPKAHRVLMTLVWCALLTPVEILAGLQLDGWLMWAIFAIAARNVVIAALMIVGLAFALEDETKALQ